MSKASNSNGEIVLSIGLHCENCASTALKVVLASEGVKRAKADKELNTLTVTGDVDPEKIRELLQKEMKKEVKLISYPSKDKKAPAVVIEVGCLCSDCIHEFKKIACETKGLEGWSCDNHKLTVKVEGKVDTKALTKTLKERLNKHGQIVLVNEGGGSGGEKPESRYEVVAYGNGIVAQHVHLYINGLENLQLVVENNVTTLKPKKGHK